MSELHAPHRPLAQRVFRALAYCASGTITIAFLWVAGDQVAHGEMFRVKEVRFVGNDRAHDVQLRHLSDIRSNTHLFNVDLGRAVRGVTAHPWVASATAWRRYPGTVEIRVTEYEPALLLALEDLWYVDMNSVPFKRAHSGDLDYPILTGLDPNLAKRRPDIGRAVVWGAVRVLRACEQTPELSREQLSEVHFDPRHGFEVVLRSGSRIVLGFSNPVTPLQRLDQMVHAGLDLTRPQLVDLDAAQVAITTPLPT